MGLTSILIGLLLISVLVNAQEPNIDVKKLIEQAKQKQQEKSDMDEYVKIEEYKNEKLWACHLLCECRLFEEQKNLKHLAEQDPKLAQVVANKVFLDMLVQCYDNISMKDAIPYNKTEKADKVKCEDSKWKNMMKVDLKKYMNWRDKKDLNANVRQTVMSTSLKVN